MLLLGDTTRCSRSDSETGHTCKTGGKSPTNTDERLSRDNTSNYGALRKLPQSNPQSYPQARIIYRLAVPHIAHYLVSRQQDTHYIWGFEVRATASKED